MDERVRAALVSCATKEASNPRARYGLSALPLFLEAVDRVEELVNKGATLESAINRCFNDRLRDKMLKAAGVPVRP